MSELKGKKFGRWTVLEDYGLVYNGGKRRRHMLKCICECGFSRLVRADLITRGCSTKCQGCNARETHKKKKMPKQETNIREVMRRYLDE